MEPDATDNTNAMQCTCLHDMNECHTLTQQNDENPKDKEPGMEIDEAGYILYAQKGKYTSGALQTLLYYKKISSRDLGLEKGRVLGTKMIFSFPGSFSVCVM